MQSRHTFFQVFRVNYYFNHYAPNLQVHFIFNFNILDHIFRCINVVMKSSVKVVLKDIVYVIAIILPVSLAMAV